MKSPRQPRHLMLCASLRYKASGCVAPCRGGHVEPTSSAGGASCISRPYSASLSAPNRGAQTPLRFKATRAGKQM